jgi:hypothetical protein
MANLDLAAWTSDTPTLQVPEDLLRHSIERARIDIALRRENEFQLFKKSKFFTHLISSGQLVFYI